MPQQNTQHNHQLIVNYVPGEECRVAVMLDGKLDEFHSERTGSASHVGNIYVGRVTNVEPAISAAFVDFGLESNGFLHVSDLHPRYFGESKGAKERVGKKTPRRERPPIQDALKRGQEIIVQVLKEGVGSKGPTLTSYLSIPGRYLVMMPNMDKVGVSRKVEDEETRAKMKKILDQLELPEGFGFILRTAGFDRTKAELKRDLAYLQRLWKDMEKRRKSGGKPRLLYSESDLLVRALRDMLTSDVDRVVIDNEVALKRAARFIKIVSPRTVAKLVHYKSNTPIFHGLAVEDQIRTMYAREVPLPSGGRLVIDETEALVAIDVNSGKSRAAGDSEENAFRTNLEAAEAIVQQLRLRDMGGIVVNDLIDMRLAKHRKDVERKFEELLSADRAKSTVAPISEFGILEMTRQRMRGSHESIHFHACPTCHGRGLVQRAESVAADALREIAALLDHAQVARVEMAIHPRIAGELLSAKRKALSRIERQFNKTVAIRLSDAVPLDRVSLYAYDDQGNDIEIERLPRFRASDETLAPYVEPGVTDAPAEDEDDSWSVDSFSENLPEPAEPQEDDAEPAPHLIEMEHEPLDPSALAPLPPPSHGRRGRDRHDRPDRADRAPDRAPGRGRGRPQGPGPGPGHAPAMGPGMGPSGPGPDGDPASQGPMGEEGRGRRRRRRRRGRGARITIAELAQNIEIDVNAVLQRCRDEGVPDDIVRDEQSLIGLRVEERIREWFGKPLPPRAEQGPDGTGPDDGDGPGPLEGAPDGPLDGEPRARSFGPGPNQRPPQRPAARPPQPPRHADDDFSEDGPGAMPPPPAFIPPLLPSDLTLPNLGDHGESDAPSPAAAPAFSGPPRTPYQDELADSPPPPLGAPAPMASAGDWGPDADGPTDGPPGALDGERTGRRRRGRGRGRGRGDGDRFGPPPDAQRPPQQQGGPRPQSPLPPPMPPRPQNPAAGRPPARPPTRFEGLAGAFRADALRSAPPPPPNSFIEPAAAGTSGPGDSIDGDGPRPVDLNPDLPAEIAANPDALSDAVGGPDDPFDLGAPFTADDPGAFAAPNAEGPDGPDGPGGPELGPDGEPRRRRRRRRGGRGRNRTDGPPAGPDGPNGPNGSASAPPSPGPRQPSPRQAGPGGFPASPPPQRSQFAPAAPAPRPTAPPPPLQNRPPAPQPTPAAGTPPPPPSTPRPRLLYSHNRKLRPGQGPGPKREE